LKGICASSWTITKNDFLQFSFLLVQNARVKKHKGALLSMHELNIKEFRKDSVRTEGAESVPIRQPAHHYEFLNGLHTSNPVRQSVTFIVSLNIAAVTGIILNMKPTEKTWNLNSRRMEAFY